MKSLIFLLTICFTGLCFAHGSVQIIDALFILRAVQSNTVVNPAVRPDRYYDVDGDGEIDSSDAIKVLLEIL